MKKAVLFHLTPASRVGDLRMDELLSIVLPSFLPRLLFIPGRLKLRRCREHVSRVHLQIESHFTATFPNFENREFPKLVGCASI